MADPQRRRSPRYETDLPASYRVSADAAWRRCHVIDVSEHGATVELHDVEPGESFGPRIDLEFSSRPHDAIGVILRGQIRRRAPHVDGLVIGVEFETAGANRVNLPRLLLGLRSVSTDV
jgi:hypothetical protein